VGSPRRATDEGSSDVASSQQGQVGTVGNPLTVSVMQAMPLVAWLRPVNRHERVGEHRAVVCHCV